MDNNSLAHTKWECKYHLIVSIVFRKIKILPFGSR